MKKYPEELIITPLSLTEPQREGAAQIGKGNMSSGVRTLLDQYRKREERKRIRADKNEQETS